MTPLGKKLRARIEADGPVSVAAWMEACLADPEHGYYRTRDPLGRAGDFTTAPEISQMFGELIGLWTAVVWHQMGAPAPCRLVELGPGRGTLMSDLLRAANGVPGFTDAVRVHMVETSPALRERQREALSAITPPVAWHDAFADVPEGPCIVIANEFLDALPFCQWVKTHSGWRERTVGWTGDGFDFMPGDPAPDGTVPDVYRDAAMDSIYETSAAVSAVSAQVAARIATGGGAALFIDYGYDRPGLGDTLQAISGHAYADPLATPGDADLTAHVDFKAVAQATTDAGAKAWGALPQGVFLENLGIGARASALLANADTRQSLDIATARRRLVDADAMGRLFKVLAMTQTNMPAPPAFEQVRF